MAANNQFKELKSRLERRYETFLFLLARVQAPQAVFNPLQLERDLAQLSKLSVDIAVCTQRLAAVSYQNTLRKLLEWKLWQ